jgi:hypothetical protein
MHYDIRVTLRTRRFGKILSTAHVHVYVLQALSVLCVDTPSLRIMGESSKPKLLNVLDGAVYGFSVVAGSKAERCIAFAVASAAAKALHCSLNYPPILLYSSVLLQSTQL